MMHREGLLYGYGRLPNSLGDCDVWAKFHPKMQAVYGALLGLLRRTMQYRDTEGVWRVSYGYPTQKLIAKKSPVREADVSRITDLLEKVGILIKTPCKIHSKPRMRYILLPPEHPIYSRIGYSCERLLRQLGKRWGLTRHWGPRKATHELPARLGTHELPARLHSTDIHTPKTSPIGHASRRRMGGPPAQGSAPRSASPPDPRLPLRKFQWSQLDTAREKIELSQLVTLFEAQPHAEWEQLTVHLLEDGIRLGIIDEAKRIATEIVPHFPSGSQGS